MNHAIMHELGHSLGLDDLYSIGSLLCNNDDHVNNKSVMLGVIGYNNGQINENIKIGIDIAQPNRTRG